jgi:uncharacterized protein
MRSNIGRQTSPVWRRRNRRADFPLAARRGMAAKLRPMSASNPPAVPPRPWLEIPEVPRVVPFVLFLVLTSLQKGLFPGSEYWLYLAKTLVVGWLVWAWRDRVAELRWAFSWEAVAVGGVIAVLWLGLDGHAPTLGEVWRWGQKLFTGKVVPPPAPEAPWNPLAHFAGAPALGWLFVVVRVLGRSLVVPAVEEVFYRSFVYRYVANPKFQDVPLGMWHSVAFVVTSALFGLAHPDQWIQGILCGAAYQALVIRKQRLGDAMLAHAVTNLLISGYAIATGKWQFT